MIRRYARFVAFLLTAILTALLAWPRFGAIPAILIGFDVGTLVFFASLVSLVSGATATSMRQRSQANEPDHHLLLLLSMGIAAVTIAGIWAEFFAIAALPRAEKAAMIGLATFSLALVWLFANALGTIHYAHLWYLQGDNGKDARGLDFPGPDHNPDYLDFAYFAAVLSMTFQVSDVQVTTKPVRRLVLLHGLVAFLFNISVIAISVSLVSNALGN